MILDFEQTVATKVRIGFIMIFVKISFILSTHQNFYLFGTSRIKKYYRIIE